MEIYKKVKKYLELTEVGVANGSVPGHRIAQYQPLSRDYQLYGSSGYEKLFEVSVSTFHEALLGRYKDTIKRDLADWALGTRDFSKYMEHMGTGLMEDETTGWVFPIQSSSGFEMRLICRTRETADLTRVLADSWSLSRGAIKKNG